MEVIVIIEVPLFLLWSDLTVQDEQQMLIFSEVEAFWDSVVPGISIKVIITTLGQMISYAVGKWVWEASILPNSQVPAFLKRVLLRWL
jgi:hypothetical protein